MADYIDRDLLLAFHTKEREKAIKRGQLNDGADDYDLLMKCIMEMEKEPSVLCGCDKQRKNGKWIEVSPKNHCGMKCNLCNAKIPYREYYSKNYKYCYHCGAYTEGEAE